MGVPDSLTVQFAGEGSGVAGLTWGQQAIWRAFEVCGQPIWLTGITAVPAGRTVQDLAGRLVYRGY